MAYHYVGYFHAHITDDYQFRLTASAGVRLLLDYQSIFYDIHSDNETTTVFSLVINLSEGYHPLEIFHLSPQPFSSFHLSYNTRASNGTWLPVDKAVLLAGGISPINLMSSNIITYQGNSITTPPPSVNGMKCSQFFISPLLPSDLTLNVTTGVISGKAQRVVYSEYTLICHSDFGIAETTIVVSLRVLPQSGMQVSYACDDTLVLTVIESSINHPLVESGVIWPSLPLRLFRGFSAKWDGLLYIGIKGSYSFRLVVMGIVRVLIDNTIVFQQWNPENDTSVFIFSYTFTTANYYSLIVEYECFGFDSGIQLYMKSPSSSQYTILTTGYLYHDMHELFVYTTKQMLCVVNTTTISNSPLFSSHLPSSFEYSSEPPLPSGLDWNNGVITGIPTEVITSQTYTITAYSSEVTLETTVIIEVQAIETPKDLIVYDMLGRHYTSFSVYRYSYINPLLLSSSIPNVIWRIKPTLPEGFILDNHQQRIIGRAQTLFPNRTFTIQAQSNGGQATIAFPIEVKGCEYGQFMYTSFSNGTTGLFVVKGKEIVVNETIVTGDYGTVLCLPNDSYRVRILCSNPIGMHFFHLFREDGLCLLMSTLVHNTWIELPFHFNDTYSPVIITRSPNITTRVNTLFRVRFSVQHSFYPITFSPSLPSSFHFDQRSLQLSGSYSDSAVLTFTVTATNDYGKDAVVLTVYVDSCPKNSELYRLSRLSSEETEGIKIYLEDKLIYSTLFGDELFDEYICLSQRKYDILLIDEDGLGWMPGSDLVITDSLNRYRTSFILDAGMSSVHDSLNLTKMVTEQSVIRYLISTLAPSSDWMTDRVDDSQWPSGSFPHWPTVPSSLATVYFRQVVSITEGSLAVHLFFKEGCVLYIDGDEVSRFNLPEGPLYHSTTATSFYNTTRWVTSFSSFYHSPKRIVIAAALHRSYVVVPSSIDFDWMITSNLSPRILLSLNSMASPSVVVDGKRDTSWRVQVPTTAQFTFTECNYIVTHVAITVGTSFLWEVPSILSIYGVNREGFQVLGRVVSKSLFKRPFSTVLVPLSPVAAFHDYRVVVEHSLNTQSVDIRGITFYSATTVHCSLENSWSETTVGCFARGKCSMGYIGETHRSCHREGFHGKWDNVEDSTCLVKTPRLNNLFFDSIALFSNVTQDIWMEGLELTVLSILKKEMVIEDITLVPYGDVSTDQSILFKVGVRVQEKKKKKSEVYQRFMALHTSINELLRNHGVNDTTVRFEETITIRDASVFLLCFVFLLLLLLVLTAILVFAKRAKQKCLRKEKGLV